MKTNIVVLSILAIYFGLLATVYTVWSLIADGAMEWAGSLAIALSGVLSLLIAFFLQIQFKNQGGELPEDRLEANIDDGDADNVCVRMLGMTAAGPAPLVLMMAFSFGFS